MIFLKKFRNKKVLLTGHTGFKGLWTSIFLNRVGARVYGVSRSVDPEHKFYTNIDKNRIFEEEFFFDVVSLGSLSGLIEYVSPDYIIHMAAQAIVSEGFLNPYDTFSSNAFGTLSILEALRQSDLEGTSCLLVTTDKVYKNSEENFSAYSEDAQLGSSDPYSASKAVAEVIAASYALSFGKDFGGKKFVIARAGNVLGGGDWSKNRVIPDLMDAWISRKSTFHARNLQSVRPWQHVLDTVAGYLKLLSMTDSTQISLGEAFNFGPPSSDKYSVEDLLVLAKNILEERCFVCEYSVIKNAIKEFGWLSITSEKTEKITGWRNRMDINQVMEATVRWYENFDKDASSCLDFTLTQIDEYIEVLGDYA